MSRPIEDFPLPMKPMSTMFWRRAETFGDGGFKAK
jgi:hypothetical protein